MKYLATLIIALAAGFVGAQFSNHSAQNSVTAPSTFDHVLETNTLKCGYWNFAPLFTVDSNTGALGGIFHDYVNAIGDVLDITIAWTEELGYADFYLAIQQGRVDAMCAGVWPLAPRAKVMEFTDPIFYIPMHFYARTGDTRFDNNLTAINDQDVTVSTMDGLVARNILEQRYPQAELISITDINPLADLYHMLVTGKVDVTLNDVFSTRSFTENNPGQIRKIPSPYPVTLFGNTIAVDKDEMKLKRLLDFATQQLQAAGVVEEILQRHEPEPGLLYRPNHVYRNPQ